MTNKIFKYKIYVLFDPVTKDVRYVGFTTHELKMRLKAHIGETKSYLKQGKKFSHKLNWINSLLKKELKPEIMFICENEGNIEEVSIIEQFWIKCFMDLGYKLVNGTNGGSINMKMTEETKIKMSESKKGIKKGKMLEEQKLKISQSKKKLLEENPELRELYREKATEYENSKTDEQKLQDILIQKTRKEVLQYDLEGNFIKEYPSINNAAKENKLDGSNIQRVCIGKYHTIGSFIWKFKN